MVRRRPPGAPTNKFAAMITRHSGELILCIAFVAVPTPRESRGAQSASPSLIPPESSAADIKGVRHRKSDYGEGRAPWHADLIKFVKTDYPTEAKAHHIEGTGLFRMTLDVNMGFVATVAPARVRGRLALLRHGLFAHTH